MRVKYTGSADFQEFGAADFKKADLEGNKISFPKGQAVEVSDEIGQALTSDEGLFGSHSFEEVKEEQKSAEGDSSGEQLQLGDPHGSPDEPPAVTSTSPTETTKTTTRPSTR